MMGKVLFLLFLTFSLSSSWVHDGRIIGFELVRDAVLPVNYFFVQLVDVYGRNFTNINDNHKNLLKFEISDHCKRYSQDLIHTGDGLFIVRLRNFEECHNIQLTIKYDNRHLNGSPFCLKDVIPEQCECPRNMNKVMNAMKCPSFNRQINHDLKPFPQVNFTKIKAQVLKQFQNFKSSSLCNYLVKRNKIYRKCYGQYTGFSMFMDNMLVSLTNKVYLPDFEFFINLGDWPLIRKSAHNIPIFSWCSSIDNMDIVLPTYDLTESILHMFYRVTLDTLSIQKEQWKWKEKIEKAFFRGRDSRRERLELIDISRTHPDLLNASITNFFFFTKEIHKYGPKVGHIPFTDFFEYKYQVNMDGTVAAYRLPYLLAGNSVVLKQESPYYEHFYRDLIPFKHFIPFHRDPKLDLVEKIRWLKKHDKQAQQITKNARDFVRENLLPSNIFCYYLMLFKNYSERIVSPIEVSEDMEKVDTKSWKCSCTKNKIN
ncbi:CLUMA_CG014350, isoform A [Clunio marinus]|uniref:CLUMA_CG014350, isoform A n=1 Tax=Clunio marinus TaxID=568069 RepID=A0A1J1IMD6_9DIPT|nr:CLUMA_CG014350, isoform A [Clunio marinus]